MIEKLERDGKIAVIYSDDYGAGWSTWNSTDYTVEELVFDKALAEFILTEPTWEEKRKFAKERFPLAYDGGADCLEVEWVPKGTGFFIHEYDGLESVWTKENMHWLEA